MKKIIMFIFGILLISLVSAQVSYCCEKTTYGAWCQNEELDKCDKNFNLSATSCEQTSYCREGCCYNSQEGTCTSHTSKRVCRENNGIWNAESECDIPQCELGCCLIGNQAAFVTQTRCKRLSNLYGLDISFRKDISTELQCVLSTTSEVEGACVFEEEFELTCKRLTQKQCRAITDSSFYEGKLCSSEELGTNCAPTEKTTCVEGEDAVYFVDSCGNIANVYDASKINNQNYWSEIKDVSESCNPNQNNANSPSCGNCDYFLGSTCKEYNRVEDEVEPSYGDYICRDLGCKYQGETYEHGEAWCAVVSNGEVFIGNENIDEFNEEDLKDKNLPGSRYYRLLCYNGEVIVEPCSDFRQEICLQGKIEVEGGEDFLTAACRANRWQDCSGIEDKKNCENTDKRDCVWLTEDDIDANYDVPIGGLFGGSDFSPEDIKICVPKYSPGFDFWESVEDSESVCEIGTRTCTVTYEKGIIDGDWKPEDNAHCLQSTWREESNAVCSLLGDCGVSLNYMKDEGFYDLGDLFTKEGEEVETPDE